MRRRLVYSALTALCLAACVLIVKYFSGSQLIRGLVGDIIVISLVYFFIKAFHDFDALRLAGFTLALAFVIEFLQYLNLIELLGLEHSRAARLILGSVFDPYDLIAYTIGAVLVYIVDTRLIMRKIV